LISSTRYFLWQGADTGWVQLADVLSGYSFVFHHWMGLRDRQIHLLLRTIVVGVVVRLGERAKPALPGDFDLDSFNMDSFDMASFDKA
jgi:hypothetical protein